MKFKSIFVVSAVLVLSACSKPYDYSGVYETTKGNDCEPESEKVNIITVSPASEGSDTYTARVSSHMLGGGMFPLESKPSKISKDGSITFMFFQEGKYGFFSSKPTVDMKIKLAEKDDKYVYLESWPVDISMENHPELAASFDFVKDIEISMMGEKAPNEISQQAGKKGLCLKKVEI